MCKVSTSHFTDNIHVTLFAYSSPALYDRPHKIIQWLAEKSAGVPGDETTSQLDDVICVSVLQGAMAWTESYKQLCASLGVQLAPDDGTKGFGASRAGTVLGIHFDLDTWTWSLAEDKEVKILRLLYKVVNQDQILLSEAKTLAGNICLCHMQWLY